MNRCDWIAFSCQEPQRRNTWSRTLEKVCHWKTTSFLFQNKTSFVDMLNMQTSPTRWHNLRIIPGCIFRIRRFLLISCLRYWGRILLRLTPAGSACWINTRPPQSDTLHMVLRWLQQVPLLCQMLSHGVSVDSHQHQRSLRFVFDFLKLYLYQHVFVPTFSSVHANRIIFTTYMYG